MPNSLRAALEGAAATLEVGGERPRVLVIRDTRESGEMLEAALAAGIASAGGDRRLEHLTRLAGVADDQHALGPTVRLHARSGRAREGKGELRREELARDATDTVGAEELAGGA